MQTALFSWQVTAAQGNNNDDGIQFVMEVATLKQKKTKKQL